MDSSFDVALVMTFASPRALRAYLLHPAHKRALRDDLQPLVKRLLIYDFVD